MALIRARALRCSVRGALTTDAAMFLPVLVLLLLAGAESGWVMWRARQVEAATLQGAAVAAAHFSTNALVGVAVDDAMQRAGLGDTEYRTRVEPGDVLRSRPGEPVSVIVSVPYENLSLTRMARLPFLPSAIEREVSLPKEGPYRPASPGYVAAP